jgi:hypothetical protein
MSESFDVNLSFSGQVDHEKIFEISHFILVIISPFKWRPGHLFEFHLLRDDLHQVSLKLAWFFGRKIFKWIFSAYFMLAIISPWRNALPFI